MTLKDVAVNVFRVLSRDEALLELLEVPITEVNDVATLTMKDIKKQIIEDRYPNDLVEDNLSRLCVFENPSTPTFNQFMERCWLEVDIYVTKEKDNIDRKVLIIADHVIKLLDGKERAKHGLPPVATGVGLYYYNKLPSLKTDRPEWKKFGLVFYYNEINL